MSANSPTYLPLFGFFEAWRTQGAQIGLPEYMALLQAMQAGYGFSTEEQENLFALCKSLWFNPGDSFFQFKRLFSQFYELERSALLSFEKKLDEDKQPQEPPKPREPEQKPPVDENDKPEPEPETDKDLERLPESQQNTPAISNSGEASSDSQFIQLGKSAGSPSQFEWVESQQNADLVKQQFKFTAHPFPTATNPRIIRLLLRKLFSSKGKKRSGKINIPKTVDQMARDGGKLLKVRYHSTDILSAKVLVLLDIGTGMQAFHKLAHQFLQLMELELDQPVPVLYFSSQLKNSFFVDRSRTEAIAITELQRKWGRQHIPMLIISDAGAAKQEYDSEDIIDTEVIVHKLKKISQRIAWLNPMPEIRWTKPYKSNAGYLHERGLPMFDMTHKGIQLAVEVLKGMKPGNQRRSHGR